VLAPRSETQAEAKKRPSRQTKKLAKETDRRDRWPLDATPRSFTNKRASAGSAFMSESGSVPVSAENLEHLSALDDFSAGVRALDRVTRPRVVGDKTVKGINFFEPGDSALLHALQDPKVNIAGIRRGELIPDLDMFSLVRLSRQLRRLLDLGLIKRVTGTYRYYLTKAGRAATAAAEWLTAAVIILAMV
jgi:hypothetical protein